MDKKQPKISVVVPVYNNKKYLKRCMDSIAAQSYHDFEVILIDDGSTDGSGALCDSFTTKDERVRVIHQKNKGLASSRKRGVDVSRGTYVIFVDSDDYIAPHMLETLYVNAFDFDIVSCGFLKAAEGYALKEQNVFEKEYIDFFDNKEMVYAYFDKKYLNGSACGKLVRREMYEQIDMCEGAVPGEEICSTLQLYQIAKKVRALSTPMYYYWQNEAGISRSGYTERHRRGLINYINLCDTLIERFPEIKVKIGAYFCEHEMAIMTAMCRNDRYDMEVIQLLKLHLKKHFPKLLKNHSTAVYYKASALMIIANYKCFAFIFKRIRKSVGR